ncbi:MAG: MCP four helix bundle domain-containing protein, partial [Rhizobium sp.]
MKRPSIKTALISIFALIAVLFGVTAYCALSGMAVLNNSTSEFSSRLLPSITVAKDIQLGRYRLKSDMQSHIAAQTDDDMRTVEKDFAVQETALQNNIDAYAPFVETEAEDAAHKALGQAFLDYKEHAAKVLALSAANKKPEALDMYNKVMTPLGLAISAQSDKIIKIDADDGASATTKSNAAYSRTLSIIYFVLAVSAFVIIGSAYFGLAGVAKPVQVITNSMTHLASGDTATAIPYADRTDEIGAMAGAVEIFRQAAIANKRLESEAEANRMKSEADRARLTADAEAAAQQRLQQATSGLAA